MKNESPSSLLLQLSDNFRPISKRAIILTRIFSLQIVVSPRDESVLKRIHSVVSVKSPEDVPDPVRVAVQLQRPAHPGEDFLARGAGGSGIVQVSVPVVHILWLLVQLVKHAFNTYIQ